MTEEGKYEIYFEPFSSANSLYEKFVVPAAPVVVLRVNDSRFYSSSVR